MNFKYFFTPDYKKYQGVRRINVYLLRVLFLLIFLFVGSDSWSYIIMNYGLMDATKAVAWSVWAAFSIVAVIGIINPVKMIPVVLLEILYKVIWLISVAYPLWINDRLTGSPAEEITSVFLWVVLPIIAVPWSFVFNNYFAKSKKQ